VQELGGSTASQLAKLANGNIPYLRCHTQFMNRGWLGGRKLFAMLLSGSLNPLLYRCLNFFSGCESVNGW